MKHHTYKPLSLQPTAFSVLTMNSPGHYSPDVTITGLYLQAQPGLILSVVFDVLADSVSITDFHLIGNYDTILERNGELLCVRGSNFLVARGLVEKAAFTRTD
jgi:hypothetical protein